MRLRAAGGRGLTLGYVLAASALLAVVGMAVAALATSSLGFASRYSAGLDAMYLAEAAVNQALAHVHQQNSYGTHPGDGVVVQPDPGDDTRKATVTFDSTSGLPYATNNSTGSGSVRGWNGAQVPMQTVRLVAVGTSHGVTRTLDVLADVPPFPYVLASGGALTANGALDVRGAASMQDFVNQESGATPSGSDAMAGVVSNVSIGAIQTSYVSGDVMAPGAIGLPSGSYVGGMVRNGTAMLPVITAAQMAAKWDPTGQPGVVSLPAVSGTDLTGLTGMSTCSTDMVVHGSVSLAGGLLFVKGALTVDGSLSGRGAVIVQGKTTIGGAVSVASDTVTALISDGDVAITGSGLKSYFQGLVYTNGSFQATSITVAGTFVATGTTALGGGAAPGTITLNNARAVYVPDAARAQLVVAGQPVSLVSSSNGVSVGAPHSARSLGPIGIPRERWVNQTPQTGPIISAFESGQTIVGPPGGMQYVCSKPAGSGVTFLMKAPNGSEPAAPPPGTVGADLSDVYLIPPGVPPDPSNAVLRVVVLGVGSAGMTSPTPPDPARPEGPYFYAAADGPAASILLYSDYRGNPGAETTAEKYGTTVSAIVNYAWGRDAAAMHAMAAVEASLQGASMSADFTLNQFLQDAQPFRVVSWKDL